MPRRDIRCHERIPCTLPVRLSWTDEQRTACYARGKCRELSPDGLRVETAETIPTQGTYLRVDKVDVAGSARVRYLRRGGVGNVIGLELKQQVRRQLLEALQERPAGS